MRITLVVNDEVWLGDVDPWESLLDVLRDRLKLTGAKKGCNYGECGACTVLMDGKAVNSCLVLAVDADGHEIVTIEGLGSSDRLHPLQKAFAEHGAVQCGFCTPGMILAAKSLLDENPQPTEQEIKHALVGNLCRCTGYTKIQMAISSAAKIMENKSRGSS